MLSSRRRSSARGFSLVELLVVLAIVGIVTALAFSSLSAFGRRAAPQTAAFELSGILSRARARALQRNTDVWLVLYPELERTGGKTRGAYFVFDDPDQVFAATYKSASFDPLQTPPGRVQRIESVHLDDYGASTLGFCVNGSVALPEPWATITPTACGFCGGSGESRRGAVVFSAEGGARFLDHAGDPIPPATGPAGNSAVFALCSKETSRPQNYLMTVSGPTGFVGVFKR